MDIQLIGSTNGMQEVPDFLKFSQACGRQCYSGKSFDELKDEPYDANLVEGRLLKSGHHSVFEHINLTFAMSGLPKIMAMILNNERQYSTSEKSARYTQMKDIDDQQKALYDKWMERLTPVIDQVYPKMKDPEARATAVRKLAQENARYVTSVFTPTKMIHTINLRQLNFIAGEFQDYVARIESDSENVFEHRVGGEMEDFLRQTERFKIDGLENQTDRHLSLFDFRDRKEHFGDTYSTTYLISFAGLAQAHRHRTIAYNMQTPEIRAPYGFFVPEIVKEGCMEEEWNTDLKGVASYDFPQAQLTRVNERGLLENFRSKAILRLCGHAQYEIMSNTKDTAIEYEKRVPEVGKWIKPKCQQDTGCKSKCTWTGKQGLTRIV